MKLLEDIPGFPKKARETLESEYGIESAEAFYAHAVHDPDGLRDALKATQPELDRIVKVVEGHLSPEFLARCKEPITRHPRGMLTDRD
jgi:hypothetical protein